MERFDCTPYMHATVWYVDQGVGSINNKIVLSVSKADLSTADLMWYIAYMKTIIYCIETFLIH